MSSALWSTLGLFGSAIIAGFFGWVTQRQVRKTGTRAEDRADFQTLRDTYREDHTALRTRVATLEATQATDRHILSSALRFIVGLTGQMRSAGLEPPPLPPELAARMGEEY